jgi:hypothetical protein
MMTPRPVTIAFKLDGSAIALHAGERDYTWPTTMVPRVVRALRACVGGSKKPSGCDGLVFAIVDNVALTDAAGMRADCCYVVTKRGARELAAGLKETYRQATARRAS